MAMPGVRAPCYLAKTISIPPKIFLLYAHDRW